MKQATKLRRAIRRRATGLAKSGLRFQRRDVSPGYTGVGHDGLPASGPLPLRVVIQVDATNGTTLLEGIEQICRRLRTFQLPRKGEEQVCWEGGLQFWRVKVLRSEAWLRPWALKKKDS